MLPIHTILHPTDFSERSAYAFPLACALARDMINTPANDLGPLQIETIAREIAEQHAARITVIVGDGLSSERTPYVLLCRVHGERFEGPRVLCVHRGSQHTQHLHVHPRFTPDGKQVLFTADPRGYGQLFLAELPPFESLPTLAEVQSKREPG